MRLLFWVLTILFLTGCASGSRAPLDEFGKKVKIAEKEPVHCEMVAERYGAGVEREYAINNLRNSVGERGANVVYISRFKEIKGTGGNFIVGNDHFAIGRGYRCE